jgi:hypothetical protein
VAVCVLRGHGFEGVRVFTGVGGAWCGAGAGSVSWRGAGVLGVGIWLDGWAGSGWWRGWTVCRCDRLRAAGWPVACGLGRASGVRWQGCGGHTRMWFQVRPYRTSGGL